MSTLGLTLITCIGCLYTFCIWTLIQKTLREKYQFFALCMVTVAAIILLFFMDGVKKEITPLKVKEIPVTIVPNIIYEPIGPKVN